MMCAKLSIMARLFSGARTAILVIAALIPLRAVAAPAIVLASTTSVQDSGLLDRILPAFAQATGIEVRVIAQGTGQALETAGRGDADVVLVHDPEAEEKFISEGFGIDRRQIARNDFVIVGPQDDPAQVNGGHDAIAALKAIAAAKAPFISRGDKSGTNALELRLWKISGIDPAKEAAGSWYRDIGGGMGQALNTASAMAAYTVSDRGTWLSFGNKGPLIVSVECDPKLINRYDVIQLNPQKHGKDKLDEARQLANWLVSAEGQRAIGDYQLHGEQLFHPSATAPK
jgi:tungstate transport system substrate-binding protein